MSRRAALFVLPPLLSCCVIIQDTLVYRCIISYTSTYHQLCLCIVNCLVYRQLCWCVTNCVYISLIAYGPTCLSYCPTFLSIVDQFHAEYPADYLAKDYDSAGGDRSLPRVTGPCAVLTTTRRHAIAGYAATRILRRVSFFEPLLFTLACLLFVAIDEKSSLKSSLKSTLKSALKSTSKMATVAPTLGPALFPGIIQHHPEHRLLYCRPCSTVVLARALKQHLCSCHRLPLSQRQLLLKHCQSLDLITQRKDLQLLPDQSPALPFLPVQKGYSCCQCRYLTCSRKQARRHGNKVHKLCLQACTDSYRPVQLQSWFSGNRAQYWTLKAGAAAIPTAAATSELDELHRLEQEEIQRLERLERDYVAQEAELEDSNSTP
jgi:Orsellinic acid/F9775 biosynthesis cluster protein D